MRGLHIFADFYECAPSEMLVSAIVLRSHCIAAANAAGLTVLGEHFYQFDGVNASQAGGATGALVLAESHLAIHTWPERSSATIDIYVCNVTADNSEKAESLYRAIVEALQPGDVLVERVWRGRDSLLQRPLQLNIGLMDITPNIRLDEALTATAGVYFDATTLLARVESPYQTIEIYDTPDVGRLMRIDGVNMTSERDEFFYHENLIHPAAIAHPTPKTALIIGGGDGGAAEELLKHPSITHCDLCELDGEVITLAKQYLQAVHHGVFGDPRLHVSIDDGVRFLQYSTINYDLIYLDLTDPVGEAAALYTVDFYADCKTKLNHGGALTIHLGSPFMHPERVSAAIGNLGAVFQHVTPYFGHIPIYGATWGFAVASDLIDIAAIDATTVNTRLASRNIGKRHFYNGEMHVAIQALPEHVKTLLTD